MRRDALAKDDKPAVKGPQAAIGNDIPTNDRVMKFHFKLGGAQSVTAEFDDWKFNDSHYGHLCMARIPTDKITLVDQKGLPVDFPEGVTGEPPPQRPEERRLPPVPPGTAHPTKSKVEFGCMGKGGSFENLKIWNANPAK